MYEKLLIPLDGSPAAESALSFVDALERVVRVPIELVYAVDVSVLTTHVLNDKARFVDFLIDEAERSGRAYLRRVATALERFEVLCTVQQGKPADVIIERAAATAKTLILMATHGRSGIHRWLLGSVAEKVLRGTGAPLLLLRSAEGDRPSPGISIRSIIVPLDGSTLAESALTTATEIARGLDAEMVLMRAYELPAAAYCGKEDYLPNYDELKAEGKAAANGYLAEKAEAIRARGVKTVTKLVTDGLPADQIIACVGNFPDSLLAMSSHGRSGLQRWVLGSVTETVVRHTHHPVLVLRAI